MVSLFISSLACNDPSSPTYSTVDSAPRELRAQYRKCFPSGKKEGQRWLFSAFETSNCDAASGVPPAADTLNNLWLEDGVNTIKPYLLQAPPRPPTLSHRFWGGPPSALIFFNLPAAKKPISRP